MSGHLHFFKVTFESPNAMQDAAEAVRAFAGANPMTLLMDPPLVLWTDPDIFAGVSLYTTQPGVRLLSTRQPNLQTRPIDAADIPAGSHFVVGDDRYRGDAALP